MFKLQTSRKNTESGDDIIATPVSRVEVIRGEIEGLTIPLAIFRSQERVHSSFTSTSGDGA
jgi:hypothetical protein